MGLHSGSPQRVRKVVDAPGAKKSQEERAWLTPISRKKKKTKKCLLRRCLEAPSQVMRKVARGAGDEEVEFQCL